MRSLPACVGLASSFALWGIGFAACTGDDPSLSADVGGDAATAADGPNAADASADGPANTMDGSAADAGRPPLLIEAGALCSAADIVPTPASAVLHLDACEVTLSGTKALGWRDRVKNIFASGTATYEATGLANKPALAFGGNGAGQGYAFGADQTQLEVGINDFALFVVGNYTPHTNSSGTGLTFFAKQSDQDPYRGLLLGGSFYDGTSSTEGAGAELFFGQVRSYDATYLPTGANVYRARRKGTSWQLSIDDVDVPAATIPSASEDYSAAGFTAYIGKSQRTETALKGRIGELILLVSPTDAEVTSTSAALAKKFGH